MNYAELVKKQICNHYEFESDCDKERLKNNMIDVDIKSIFDHNGYDCSFDDSLLAIYYEDGSMLVMKSGGSIYTSGGN